MKTINIIFVFLFLFSAVLQFNDPDPLPWIFIYGLAAVSSALYILKKGSWYVSAFTGVAAFFWMLLLLPVLSDSPIPIAWADVFGQAEMKTEAVEITREILGLLIVFAWMGVLALNALKNKNIK